ncbi:MAG TPA: porin family protein [Chitinophagaceae bacterium]|nr:porin family protein [Chitinophagaceae bacterium]HNU13312.1 porin family protein [Chitinophagaceae bacterium]
MRKFLVLLCSCLIAQLLMAQILPDTEENRKKKCRNPFYATIGPQLSNINGDSESYDEGLFGFYLGFGMCLAELSDNFGLRTELNYSMQGSKYSDYVSGKVMLNYINLPILIRGTSKSGFYGEAGVQPGILTSAKDKYDGETYDYKEYINGFDFGGLLGFGYQKKKVGVGIRIAQGISNINKDEDEYKDRNFVASLRTTFTF